MSRLPAEIALAASERHGVVTREVLLNSGLTRRRIDGLLGSGFLQRLHVGVFATAGSADTELRKLVALCARFEKAVVGRTTAARLWKIRGIRQQLLEVVVPSGSPLEVPNVSFYRSRSIPPIDVVQRADGIRVTSPARTLFDLADVVTESELEVMFEQCLREQLVTLAALESVGQRLSARGRPGSTRYRSVITGLRRIQAPTQSDLELHFLRGLRSASLPEPVCQAHLRLPTGRAIRFDFAYPSKRLAIEIDGFGHIGAQAEARDQERDRLVAGLGWMTMRFVPHQVWPDAGPAVSQVAAVLSARPEVSA